MKRQEIVTLDNWSKVTGLSVNATINHTGKMIGMASLSTSTLCNQNCRKNAQIKGSICEKCFAEKQLKGFMGKNLASKLANNTEVLTSRILDFDELPIINRLYFRFEAFGDLNNDIQFINYLNICSKNPNVTFALWTKVPHIIDRVFKSGYSKPQNLILIQSSLFINQPVKKVFEWTDKTFTVWTDEKIASENKCSINCGDKKCMSCLLCYTHNDIHEINEKLK